MAGFTGVMEGVRDAITVRRVYGDPIERDNATIIPAASIMGGAGGGEGGEGEAQGTGTGFGVKARPIGAYVMRGGNVTWKPAFDLVRVSMAGIAFAALAAVMMAGVMRKRAGMSM